jgi:hypothetical protein
MNRHPCRFRNIVRLALLSVLLLGFLGGPVAPRAVGQETGSPTPSLVQSTNPSASPSPTPILAGWNWRAYFPDGKFEINQTRVIQIAALAMSLALYIIVWRNK